MEVSLIAPDNEMKKLINGIYLKVGNYFISEHDVDSFWIGNFDGEGMEVSAETLEKIINYYFIENL